MFLFLLISWRVFGSAFPVPSDAPALSHDTSLLWGPYRPNLYLGIRPQVPNSLLTGLMWSNADESSKIVNSEHYQKPDLLSLYFPF